MASPLKEGFITGSGPVLDVTASVTVKDTRIRAIQATGVGTFVVKATSIDPGGARMGNNIKFVLTAASDSIYMLYNDFGIKMYGVVSVSAPTTSATVAVFYG